MFRTRLTRPARAVWSPIVEVAVVTLPDWAIELPNGRLVTEDGEVVYAISGYVGCPWLTETRGRRRTPSTCRHPHQGATPS